MVLTLGKIKSEDLAKWFGISYNYYRRKPNKEKLLEELKDYADYEEVYGGVEIKKIYIDIYNKRKDDDMFVLDQVKTSPNGLVSASGMARIMKDGTSFDNKKRRMMKAMNRAFGSLKEVREGNEVRAEGNYGYRDIVWAIKESPYNRYRYLTNEEDELFSKLIREFSKKEQEKKAIAYTKMYDEGLMEDFEYVAKMSNLFSYYKAVIEKFREETGEILTQVSECMIYDKYKNIEDKGFDWSNIAEST